MNFLVSPIIRGYIASGGVIISFFLGYIFAIHQNEINSYKEKNQQSFIEIRTSKNKIEIVHVDKNISIIVDGKPLNEQEISLK